MRETWARRIALLTGGLVVVLAVVFARAQNPPHAETSTPTSVPAAPTTPSPLVESGRQVYVEQACARCHSIAGRGGARGALDNIGTRLSEEEIRGWITPQAKEAVGFRARHANLPLTPAERDALVAYLRSLR